jgi:hypothetical protein
LSTERDVYPLFEHRKQLVPSNDKSRLPRVTLITFGGGGAQYRETARALAKEAVKTGWFDKVWCYCDDQENEAIWLLEKNFGGFMRASPKGYGYWLWKPFLVQYVLSKTNDGDVVMYLDAGCEISKLGRDRFEDYVRLAQQSKGLFFTLPFIEKNWTKTTTLDALCATEAEKNSPQIEATWFALLNCQQTRAFVERWLSLCTIDNKALLVDEYPQNHRYDQSILSLLVKRSTFATMPWEDCYASALLVPNSWALLFPIHARRATRVGRRSVFLLSSLSSMERCKRNFRRPGLSLLLMIGLRKTVEQMLWRALGWLKSMRTAAMSRSASGDARSRQNGGR